MARPGKEENRSPSRKRRTRRWRSRVADAPRLTDRKAAQARVAEWLTEIGRERRRQGAQAPARRRAEGRGAAARARRRLALSLGSGGRGARAAAVAARCRSGRASGGTAGRSRQGGRRHQGRSRGDAAAAPHEGGGRAADRAGRHRRRLAGDAGDARADRACRHRGSRRGALSAARCRARAAGSSPPIRRSRRTGSGYIVLAMGKMGAFELNYSSDIDLIVFYDPDAPALADKDDATAFHVRITRGLVKLLQERTADGYVFRVDLRLRPDPASTQIAVSTEAALNYYGSVGQNWERAALIKARACAGDIAAGEAILTAARALHLAEISRLRGGRRHRGDEAADPRLPRPRGHRGRGPQHQARPRRHPRDRVLRADPAADRRRPASRTARPRDAGDARRARRGRLDRRRRPRRPRRRLSFPAHDRAPPADGGRRPDPYAAVGSRGHRALRALCAASRIATPSRETLVEHLRKVQRQYLAAVRGHVGAGRSACAVVSQGCRRPRDARTGSARWASASRWRCRPRCAAG